MAGAGPAPKPPGQRRRRNAAPASTQLVDGVGRPAPALPFDAHPATVVAWERVWGSPMSAVWTDGDLPGLERWAELVEFGHVERMSPALAAEIRQLEDRFGLSPLARRRLQWEIVRAQGDEGERPPAPVRKLRAV